MKLKSKTHALTFSSVLSAKVSLNIKHFRTFLPRLSQSQGALPVIPPAASLLHLFRLTDGFIGCLVTHHGGQRPDHLRTRLIQSIHTRLQLEGQRLNKVSRRSAPFSILWPPRSASHSCERICQLSDTSSVCSSQRRSSSTAEVSQWVLSREVPQPFSRVSDSIPGKFYWKILPLNVCSCLTYWPQPWRAFQYVCVFCGTRQNLIIVSLSTSLQILP